MFECTLGVMKFVYDGIASLVYCSVFAVKECPFPSHHVVRALIVDRVRCLNSSSILEQRRQIALLSLQVRVSANVLLRNEDVGHGGLASHLAERALDRGTVVHLIQLNRIKLGPALTQQLLGLPAVRTVALAEHSDGVLVDDCLDFGFRGGHCRGRGRAGEVPAEEGQGGGWWLVVGWVDGRLVLCGGVVRGKAIWNCSR